MSKGFYLSIIACVLWHSYVETLFSHCFSKFKSCYHKCINKLFGFSRWDSMSNAAISVIIWQNYLVVIISLRVPAYSVNWQVFIVHYHTPSPPLDNIRVMVTVRRLRGNIIRNAPCWVVWHNVHSQQHTYMSSSYRSSRLGLSHWVGPFRRA